MDADLDTLATALYARTDDLLKSYPEQLPYRPAVGIDPQITDAEIITLSVMQALLGYTSGARWLRHAKAHLGHLFPYLPQQPGYNKRLRKLAGTLNWLIGMLGRDTSVWTDDVWVVDSTPIECGRSRETARRSDLAGWAQPAGVGVAGLGDRALMTSFAAGVLGRDQPEERPDRGAGEPVPVPDLDREPERGQRRDTAQALQP